MRKIIYLLFATFLFLGCEKDNDKGEESLMHDIENAIIGTWYLEETETHIFHTGNETETNDYKITHLYTFNPNNTVDVTLLNAVDYYGYRTPHQEYTETYDLTQKYIMQMRLFGYAVEYRCAEPQDIPTPEPPVCLGYNEYGSCCVAYDEYGNCISAGIGDVTAEPCVVIAYRNQLGESMGSQLGTLKVKVSNITKNKLVLDWTEDYYFWPPEWGEHPTPQTGTITLTRVQ